ncbi:hypothetical protein BGY98DRAFT_85477 [Russula aff. rugulosa BPL654]|nr:hypothetical protein BGY98DRAFT_85477 [Russula aff. rugulosa BPL654]
MRPPAFTRTQVHSDRHTSTSPTPPKKPTLRALKPAHKYFNGHSHSSPGATEPLQHDDKGRIHEGIMVICRLLSVPRRLPPRRAGGQNHTAPSPGPGDNGAIVPGSPTPAPPPALNLGDDALAATQLPTPVSQTRRPPPRRRANLGIDASSALMSAASSSNPQKTRS